MATLAPRNETKRIATPIRMVRKRMASGRIDPRVPGGFGVGALSVGAMLVEGRLARQREPAIYQPRLCRNCGRSSGDDIQIVLPGHLQRSAIRHASQRGWRAVQT